MPLPLQHLPLDPNRPYTDRAALAAIDLRRYCGKIVRYR